MMTNEQCQKLLEEFSPEDIEFLSKAGRDFAFVSHPACTRRLIDVFGLDWSFEIVETKIEKDQCAVLVRLTCAGSVRMQWAAQKIERGDLDDALKGAGSRALRKAASLFGVALYLWDNPPTKAQNEQAKRDAHHNGGGAGQGGGRLTERQRKAIMAISRSLGWTPEMLRQRSIKLMGAPPEKLSKVDAGILISELKNVSSQEKGDTAPFESGGVTERQLEAIGVIAKSLGWKMPELREAAGGRDPRELTEAQADELLESLRTRTAA